MLHLALFLMLVAAGGLFPSAAQPQPIVEDLCDLGRQIGRQPPCLAGEDCEAYRLWRRALGAPRIELLPPPPSGPQGMAGGVRARRDRTLRIEGPEMMRQLVAHCPAAAHDDEASSPR